MTDPSSPPSDVLSDYPIHTARRGFSAWILGTAVALLSAALRFAYHLLYYPLAFTYDAVAWIVSAGEWAEWRRCVIPFLPPGPVLEIAHGTGTLSLDLTAAGFSVTAIDLSPAMSRIAAGKKRSRNRSAARPAESPQLVRADVRRLPFRAGLFSSAVATFPAEFFFESQTMREVARTLHPGGRWIILPTAYPEWFAARLLSDEKTISANPLWRAVRRRLGENGFAMRAEIVRRPRSRVFLILAEKDSTKIHEEDTQ
jgi:ubiquinone/menaquinone biosynthesis C-methylase UbiE